ncbi:hypothetical protein Nepgr_000513 [Nepenthes gracilis]|uniref:Ubiquitin-like domain-containing protein n=1 Tax=Nepenthes gracilis TaxID=150966 RepID=A0AAD3P6J2_NEPGR|nr:hypothetical protein Nepgr_000513 [Nepenthes gracilis]
MKLAVEILTGSLFYVEVGGDATVADLKREISTQENLPCERLILYLHKDHFGLLHDDELLLTECGVHDSSHIYLFFSPLGDGRGNGLEDEEEDHHNTGFSAVDSSVNLSDDKVTREGISSTNSSSPDGKKTEADEHVCEANSAAIPEDEQRDCEK